MKKKKENVHVLKFRMCKLLWFKLDQALNKHQEQHTGNIFLG